MQKGLFAIFKLMVTARVLMFMTVCTIPSELLILLLSNLVWLYFIISQCVLWWNQIAVCVVSDVLPQGVGVENNNNKKEVQTTYIPCPQFVLAMLFSTCVIWSLCLMPLWFHNGGTRWLSRLMFLQPKIQRLGRSLCRGAKWKKFPAKSSYILTMKATSICWLQEKGVHSWIA